LKIYNLYSENAEIEFIANKQSILFSETKVDLFSCAIQMSTFHTRTAIRYNDTRLFYVTFLMVLTNVYTELSV